MPISSDVQLFNFVSLPHRALRVAGVQLFGGPIAMSLGLTDQAVLDFHTEYSELKLSVEIVDSVQQAVEHINRWGSGHTECIVSENQETANYFIQQVSVQCVQCVQCVLLRARLYH